MPENEIMQQGAAEQTQTPPPSLEQLIASNPDYKTQFDAMQRRDREAWQQQAAEEQSEAVKLSRMSEEQRERYQFKKDRAALDAEKAEFARLKLTQQMGAELQKMGYSADAAAWITGKDAETSMANLAAFDKLVKAEAQKGINTVMRGTNVPKDSTPAPVVTSRESLRGMSPQQIAEAYKSGKLNFLLNK